MQSISKTLHFVKRKLCTHQTTTSHVALPPPPAALGNQPSSPSVSVDVTTVGTSCRWNHTVYVCDWLISGNMSSRFICVVAFARIPFLSQSWKIFHYMWTPHFAYPSICSGHLGYFHTLAGFCFFLLLLFFVLFVILHGLWDLSFLTSQ